MTNTLEERYSSEITKLLAEIQDIKSVLMETQKTVELREKEVLKTHEMVRTHFLLAATHQITRIILCLF